MAADREALARWADDEFLIGHLLGVLLHEVLDLEEAVAMGSFSQDELSHAALLCDRLGDSARQKDERFFVREPRKFRCATLAATPIETWPAAVAKHLLYEEAEALRLEHLGEETVMAREEALHRRHWWAWAEALARGAAGREAVERALAQLWPLTADLFDMGLPVSSAVWRARLEAGCGRLGVRLPPANTSARTRGERTPEALATLERVLAPAQSVVRLDPTATWA